MDGTFVDGLEQDWQKWNWGELHGIWVNPPYSRADNELWARKIHTEASNGALIVALVPARVDTEWWNKYYAYAHEIRFIEGRVKFEQVGKDGNATFPSAVCIFYGDVSDAPYNNVTHWKPKKG